MGEDYGREGRVAGRKDARERKRRRRRRGEGRLEKSRQTVEQDYNLRLIKAS